MDHAWLERTLDRLRAEPIEQAARTFGETWACVEMLRTRAVVPAERPPSDVTELEHAREQIEATWRRRASGDAVSFIRRRDAH